MTNQTTFSATARSERAQSRLAMATCVAATVGPKRSVPGLSPSGRNLCDRHRMAGILEIRVGEPRESDAGEGRVSQKANSQHGKGATAARI